MSYDDYEEPMKRISDIIDLLIPNVLAFCVVTTDAEALYTGKTATIEQVEDIFRQVFKPNPFKPTISKN